MAIVIVALVMALAMMAAAFQALNIEHRGEMYRRLKEARRGEFADLDRS